MFRIGDRVVCRGSLAVVCGLPAGTSSEEEGMVQIRFDDGKEPLWFSVHEIRPARPIEIAWPTGGTDMVPVMTTGQPVGGPLQPGEF